MCVCEDGKQCLEILEVGEHGNMGLEAGDLSLLLTTHYLTTALQPVCGCVCVCRVGSVCLGVCLSLCRVCLSVCGCGWVGVTAGCV